MNVSELYPIFLRCSAITTDSRNCPQGSIFFALRGDKFDGNDYIGQALENGAAYAVGDRDLPEDSRILKVDDTLRALQSLANHHRKQSSAQIIAVTGTNGKTTTKELIAAALSSGCHTLYTQGNLNNHIGVPLTLLRLKPEHRFAVVEMGANHPGEIRELCRMAEPDFGLITNVGKAHLEGFGSLEGVIRAKTELYDFLREKNGIVFGNTDNPFLKDRYAGLTVIGYGAAPENFVYGRIKETEPALEIEWGRGVSLSENKPYLIRTHLTGTYNFENIMAAICVASYLGIDSAKINRAIADYIPQNNRSQHLETGNNHLVMDAYNANPSSMEAALNNFLSRSVSPKMVILGEMRELGEYSNEEHQKIVDRLLQSRIDRVILCGENFRACHSVDPAWRVFSQTPELIDFLRVEKVSGYHILIKGSRTNQLEKIIETL